MRRADWHMVAVALALLVATPVVVWWLVGPQREAPSSYEARDPDRYLDYIVRAPDIDPAVERTAGLAGLAVLVGAVATAAIERDEADPRWPGVMVAITAAGVLGAAAGRVITGGVHGANIGGGLCIMFGGPIIAALVIAALVRSIQITCRPTHRETDR